MVDKICFDLNCYKFFKLNVEPCAETLFYVYIWFYNWPDQSPVNLINHLDAVTENTKKKLRQYFNRHEIGKLTKMRDNESILRGFDISFYYKLIQFAINSDLIAPLNDAVWKYNCPPNLQDKMEHLIFLLKEDRNKISHKDETILNLTNSDLDNYCQTLLKRLPAIIRQAGERTGVNQAEIGTVCDNLVKQIGIIHDQESLTSVDRAKVLNYIRKQDLEIRYFAELKTCFNGELKGYAPLEFLRSSDDTEVNTKELLYVTNCQVLVITGGAGYGKTSLTKFLFYQWLLRNSTAVKDLSSYDIVFRIPCRNIHSSDISEFLKDEIPTACQNMPTDLNYKKFLEGYKILWILDGFDESTAAFQGFFKSLLTNLQKGHKIIITSRPDCLEDIQCILMTKNMPVSYVSVKNFLDRQIIEVAENFLKNNDKVKDFLSFYESLDYDSKEFMTTPINLYLSLMLWLLDPNRLQGKLVTYNLYKMSFDEQVKLLVERHEDRTCIRKKDYLKIRVKNWFSQCLCKIAAESFFKSKLIIHKADELELCESAFRSGLNESFCLSTFFESEESSIGLRYFFKHKVQQEVLASLYLIKCKTNMLKRIAELSGPEIFLYHIDHFNFLFKCCDSLQFSKIFELFLKTLKSVQRPTYLLQIRNINEEFFDVLKTKIGAWEQPLELQLRCHKCESQNITDVIQYLSPDVNRFKLVIPIEDKFPMHFYKVINKVLTNFKNQKSFEITLDSTNENKLIRVFQMFEIEENHQLIKEIVFHYSFWQKESTNEVFSMTNFEKYQFRALNNCTQFFPILSCLDASSSTTGLSRMSYHAHFDMIYCGDDPAEMLIDLLKVSQKFNFVSVDLDITNYGLPKVAAIQDDWMLEFQSSMKVKILKMKFHDIRKDNLYLQIVNCVNIENLELNLYKVENNLILEQTLEEFFDIWNFHKLTKLKEINFEIILDQLIALYKKIPSSLINKTSVTVVDETSIILFFKIVRPSKSMNDILDSSAIPESTAKQFKKIRIPNGLPVKDNQTIDSLKEITELCDFY